MLWGGLYEFTARVFGDTAILGSGVRYGNRQHLELREERGRTYIQPARSRWSGVQGRAFGQLHPTAKNARQSKQDQWIWL